MAERSVELVAAVVARVFVAVVVVVVEYYSYLIIIIFVVRDQLPACLVHVKALFSRKYCVSSRRGDE